MEPSDEDRRNAEIEEFCMLQAGINLAYYECLYLNKQPCHTSIRTGSAFINEIINGSENRCYNDFRMNKSTFIALSKDLVNLYGLQPTNRVEAYESVGIFLMTCAYGVGNRLVQEMFNHSGETVSRHFHLVLKALKRMSKIMIKPDEDYQNGTGFHTPQNIRYLPFKDCIGALDGTHIKASVPAELKKPYFGRKGYTTQNILAVCDFNMCFTFVWAGWEGNAHDARIFGEAIRNPELGFPHPIDNKYYLVDSGYPHMKGYMAPYKGSDIRYHLEEFRQRNNSERRPQSPKEKFNYLHSSCRMIIERTFGVWKSRFAILANMPSYSLDTQTDIILATMAVHNYIRKKNLPDIEFVNAEFENYENAQRTEYSSPIGESSSEHHDLYWQAVRDMIAEEI